MFSVKNLFLTCALQIDAHEDDVNAVAFADASSQILFSGGDDGLVKVWDRRMLSEENPNPVGVLAGHVDGITFIDSKVSIFIDGFKFDSPSSEKNRAFSRKPNCIFKSYLKMCIETSISLGFLQK